MARPLARWYVLATSAELRQKPLSRSVFDLPVVLFRDGRGEARALLDRLDPKPLEAADTAGGMFGAREKRLWDAYGKLHASV